MSVTPTVAKLRKISPFRTSSVELVTPPKGAVPIGDVSPLRAAWAANTEARSEAPSSASGRSVRRRARPYVIRLLSKDTGVKTLRQKLWLLLDSPSSSSAAQAVAACIMLLVFVSALAFVLETLPEFHNRDQETWFVIEAVCIAFFTLEFVLRAYSCPSARKYVYDPLNWVDFLAIAPFYVELFTDRGDTGSSVFRILRLVRVFRVFKLGRYVTWIRLFYRVLAESAGPLSMLLFIMIIAVLVFSTVMYFVEEGSGALTTDGRPAFSSIPDTFWFCIVTMTTVGYGDVVPTTSWGKLLAGLGSVSGILVLAVPITVISANFAIEFHKMSQMKHINLHRIHVLQRELQQAYREAYAEADVNLKDGVAPVHSPSVPSAAANSDLQRSPRPRRRVRVISVADPYKDLTPVPLRRTLSFPSQANADRDMAALTTTRSQPSSASHRPRRLHNLASIRRALSAPASPKQAFGKQGNRRRPESGKIARAHERLVKATHPNPADRPSHAVDNSKDDVDPKSARSAPSNVSADRYFGDSRERGHLASLPRLGALFPANNRAADNGTRGLLPPRSGRTQATKLPAPGSQTAVQRELARNDASGDSEAYELFDTEVRPEPRVDAGQSHPLLPWEKRMQSSSQSNLAGAAAIMVDSGAGVGDTQQRRRHGPVVLPGVMHNATPSGSPKASRSMNGRVHSGRSSRSTREHSRRLRSTSAHGTPRRKAPASNSRIRVFPAGAVLDKPGLSPSSSRRKAKDSLRAPVTAPAAFRRLTPPSARGPAMSPQAQNLRAHLLSNKLKDPRKQKVDKLRLELTKEFYRQADRIVERSQEILIDKIGELVTQHRRIVESQMQKLLMQVPVFVREAVDPQADPTLSARFGADVLEEALTPEALDQSVNRVAGRSPGSAAR